MTDTDPRPFWLDWEYDRDNADTGTRSRFGNYLRQADHLFREIWYDDPTVEVARLAWRTATGPVMAPPLVRSHPRITGATLHRNDWDGGMFADIQLVAPRPHVLAGLRTPGFDWWRDQHRDAWDMYEGVGGEDLAKGRAYLLTEARMLWQIPAGTLPEVKEVPSGAALFDHAVECLRVLVAALNREVGPVIEKVEGS